MKSIRVKKTSEGLKDNGHYITSSNVGSRSILGLYDCRSIWNNGKASLSSLHVSRTTTTHALVRIQQAVIQVDHHKQKSWSLECVTNQNSLPPANTPGGRAASLQTILKQQNLGPWNGTHVCRRNCMKCTRGESGYFSGAASLTFSSNTCASLRYPRVRYLPARKAPTFKRTKGSQLKGKHDRPVLP